MTANTTVSQSIAVADPEIPANVIKPNADGSVNISGSISVSATTTAHATAAAPSYSEGTDDDLSMNLTGDLRTTAKIAAGQTIAVTNAGTFAVTQATAANLNATVVGVWEGATGSAVPASGVYNGLIAATANPAAASAGNLVGAMADKLGRQVVVIGQVRDLKANTHTALSSGSETTVVAQVASTFLDVYGCIAANTTGSAVTLVFKDSTSGTTQFTLYVPANDTRGFMLPSSDGFKQGTVNTNWTCTGGASGVDITMLYVKNI